MIEARTFKTWGYMALAVAGSAAIAILPLTLLHRPALHTPPDSAWLVVAPVSAAIALAWALVFATLAFLSQDEFLRQRSKVAWYWGGAVGLAVTAPIYVFISLGGLHWLAPSLRLKPGQAFSLGYLLPAMGQFIGFVIASAWARFRGVGR